MDFIRNNLVASFLVVMFVVGIVVGIIFYYVGRSQGRKHPENYHHMKTKESYHGVAQGPMAPGGPRGTGNDLSSAQEVADLVSGKGKYGGNCVLMVYSPGCGHCTNTKPAFMQASKMSKAGFYLVDISRFRDQLQGPGSGLRSKIVGVPHIVMLSGGKEVDKYSGDRSAPSFAAFSNRVQMPEEAYQ
jgi:thiol-disulfide isomerase/thioredoxin